MGLVKEFRDFAVKGNMIDMAVGIIIGGAFGKCVSSLVADVLMPPLGFLMGRMDFTAFKLAIGVSKLGTDGKPLPPVDLRYGTFLSTVLDFVIVAAAVFMMIKGINTLRRQKAEAPAPPPPPPPPPSPQEKLLAEIRDLLRAARS